MNADGNPREEELGRCILSAKQKQKPFIRLVISQQIQGRQAKKKERLCGKT
jgi:hypothetical protein